MEATMKRYYRRRHIRLNPNNAPINDTGYNLLRETRKIQEDVNSLAEKLEHALISKDDRSVLVMSTSNTTLNINLRNTFLISPYNKDLKYIRGLQYGEVVDYYRNKIEDAKQVQGDIFDMSECLAVLGSSVVVLEEVISVINEINWYTIKHETILLKHLGCSNLED